MTKRRSTGTRESVPDLTLEMLKSSGILLCCYAGVMLCKELLESGDSELLIQGVSECRHDSVNSVPQYLDVSITLLLRELCI